MDLTFSGPNFGGPTFGPNFGGRDLVLAKFLSGALFRKRIVEARSSAFLHGSKNSEVTVRQSFVRSHSFPLHSII